MLFRKTHLGAVGLGQAPCAAEAHLRTDHAQHVPHDSRQ
eukprot:COSAG06_NODE_2481_length_6793_cov_20.207051_12_plen_38_part_01